MTHDELLANIDNYKSYAPIDYGQFDLVNALCAVVELHRPFHDQVLDCVQCKVEFPCPTIQAIEEELG